MSLLGGLIQLLQNTVSSKNLSVSAYGALAGEVLAVHTPAIGGVYQIELHILDSPAQSVAVCVGGTAVFTPATSAAPGAGAYRFQVTTLSAQTISLMAVADIAVVYADLIITQIG